jgi:hypothetical protein
MDRGERERVGGDAQLRRELLEEVLARHRLVGVDCQGQLIALQ